MSQATRWMIGGAVITVALGVKEGSGSTIGAGLMCAAFATAPLHRRLVRDRDGDWMYGCYLVGVALLLLPAAVLVFGDRHELGWPSPLEVLALWVSAPLAATAGLTALALGVRFVVSPRPNYVRNRRRRRPRAEASITVLTGEAGYSLVPEASRWPTWRLPAGSIVDVKRVGPEHAGVAVVRVSLGRPLDELEPPGWARHFNVDPEALEFPTPVDFARELPAEDGVISP